MSKSASAVQALELQLQHQLRGRYITRIERHEYSWLFLLGEGVCLTTECQWRVIVDGTIAHACDDDGQKFGLPAPVAGQAKTFALLAPHRIRSVALRQETGDLIFAFENGALLEVINCSSGYEAWQLSIGSKWIIAQGGGQIALWETNP